MIGHDVLTCLATGQYDLSVPSCQRKFKNIWTQTAMIQFLARLREHSEKTFLIFLRFKSDSTGQDIVVDV